MGYFKNFQKRMAQLEPLEVPVEPRSAAVEHAVAPREPVLAPVDKGSSPSRPQSLIKISNLQRSIVDKKIN